VFIDIFSLPYCNTKIATAYTQLLCLLDAFYETYYLSRCLKGEKRLYSYIVAVDVCLGSTRHSVRDYDGAVFSLASSKQNQYFSYDWNIVWHIFHLCPSTGQIRGALLWGARHAEPQSVPLIENSRHVLKNSCKYNIVSTIFIQNRHTRRRTSAHESLFTTHNVS